MGDTDLQPSKGRPDFRIYTAALEVDSAESTLVRMVGSSTEQDVQHNRMALSAINDMCDPTLVGMTIFLNHKYDIPYDVYGSLIEAPKAQRKDGFVDVYLTADTDLRNPPASQVLQQIRDGRKHGCSIGCMVDKWSFAEEEEDSAKDAIVIERVKPVEWSIVGIPANRRSWVENAIYGVFTRSLDEGNYDEAYQLAPTVKSLYSRNYERLTLGLTNTSERTRFEHVSGRPAPTHQLFWEPSRKTFILQGVGGLTTDVDRETITTLLAPPTLVTADGAASAKSAQEARSHTYHIGIKDGGHVTKPSEWSSVPDSEWGDPVNYRYPMPDKAHADNAASRWGDASNRSQYSSEEQAIIGGRISRRQSHFGESGEKETKDVKPELLEAAVAVQADGSHEPTTGHHNHPHADMHDGLHDHHHTHDGDNNHSHSHDHHMPQENTAGGDPDGDADDQAMECAATPTDAASVAPVTVSATLPETDRAAYLQSYNALGRVLGFAAVDGTRPEPTPQEAGATLAQFAQAIEVLERLSLSMGEALENLYLSLALTPNLTLSDTTLIARVQRAHDTLANLLAHTTPESAPSVEETPPAPHVPVTATSVPNTALTLAVDMREVQGEVTRLQAQLAEQKAQQALLAQQYETLRGQGLGRPTSFTDRAVPASMLGSTVSIEAQTPDELKKGTAFVKRLDGVLCRKWPHGHGVHQRPELSTTQMSIMTNVDVRNYYDGLEVLVPHFADND